MQIRLSGLTLGALVKPAVCMGLPVGQGAGGAAARPWPPSPAALHGTLPTVCGIVESMAAVTPTGIGKSSGSAGTVRRGEWQARL